MDIADLSEGFTFINKNLFPILYPDQEPDAGYDFRNPVPGTDTTPAYGMHFLQWPSNFHESDFQNMPVEDSAIVLQRLALLEDRILHSQNSAFPDTSAYEETVHHGWSGIIKNFGHLVGGSLAHGHQQIAFTNIMPLVLAQDLEFREKNGESFISFLKRENPSDLTLEENGSFSCVVPYFMKRPLQTVIYYKGEAEYFHHIPAEEMKDLAVLLKKNIASVISLMEQIGREPAYNIIFHSGPGSEFYLEMLPYTQETGGYEYLGIYVCQGSINSTLDMYRNYAEF
jgi:galactose-1-phosphate uridylyltransferase